MQARPSPSFSNPHSPDRPESSTTTHALTPPFPPVFVPGRNPSLKQQLFSYAILGFALSEAMGLFCLMVAFLILFAM